MSGTERKEFRDYQTPIDFACSVCSFLKNQGIEPEYVIEPTCGVGNFVKAARSVFSAKRYYGIEINRSYYLATKESLPYDDVTIRNEDLFDFDLNKLDCGTSGDSVLIVGNLPWVSNSGQGAIGSRNIPAKTNFKKMRGMDALTGESNFDVSEYMILKLVNAYRFRKEAVAVLCKTSVARNAFLEIGREGIRCSAFSMYRIDAKKIFNVAAEGCLLCIGFDPDEPPADECKVYDFDRPGRAMPSIRRIGGKLTKDSACPDFDGRCEFEWRQGVKHDCSAVMELRSEGGILRSKAGEPADIEGDYIYDYVKDSDIKEPVISGSDRKLLVTQRKVGEDTAHIEADAPKT